MAEHREADPGDLVLQTVGLAPFALELERPRSSDALLDEELFAEDEFLPYWAELWPSALALAAAVAPRALHGARVVELGCGLGVPSLAAAGAGGRVLATDWAADALAVVARNAARNDLSLQTAVVDWRAPDALVAAGPWDLVLASDVLYEAHNAEPLVALLGLLGAEVLLADPGRVTAEPFFTGAAEAGWRAETVADGVQRLRPGRAVHQSARS